MTKDCNSCNHHLQGRTINDCPSICWSCFDHTTDPLVLKNWTPKSKDIPSVKTVMESVVANAARSAHYEAMDIEPWDVVSYWPIEQQIGAYRHGLLKYTMRMGSKDARLQEAEKGLDYAKKLVEVLRLASSK